MSLDLPNLQNDHCVHHSPIPIAVVNHDEVGVVGVQRWTTTPPDFDIWVVPSKRE